MEMYLRPMTEIASHGKGLLVLSDPLWPFTELPQTVQVGVSHSSEHQDWKPVFSLFFFHCYSQEFTLRSCVPPPLQEGCPFLSLHLVHPQSVDTQIRKRCKREQSDFVQRAYCLVEILKCKPLKVKKLHRTRV